MQCIKAGSEQIVPILTGKYFNFSKPTKRQSKTVSTLQTRMKRPSHRGIVGNLPCVGEMTNKGCFKSLCLASPVFPIAKNEPDFPQNWDDCDQDLYTQNS